MKHISLENIINKLSIFALIISFFTFATIVLFPIFSDEIQIRMWLSRLPYDFPNRVTGLARCFSAFSHKIPFAFYIPATLNWIIHGVIESPSFLRFISLSILMLWMSTLIRYAYIQLHKNQSFNFITLFTISAIILSIFFIGINPIFIGINRNEQLYYPSLILILMLTINQFCYKDLKIKLLITTTIIVLFGTIFYGHPKGLFFIPFFIVISWNISNNFSHQKSIFTVLIFLILYLSLVSHTSWSNSYLCKEIPEFEEFMKTFYFDPLSIFYNPTLFINKAYLSVSRFTEYLGHFEFKRDYIWNFLPSIKNFNIYHIFVNFLIKTLISSIYLFTLFYLLVFSFKKNVKRKINFLLLTLFICTSTWAIFNLTKNIYDASFFYTVTSIIFIFMVIENNLLILTNRFFKIFTLIIFSISLTSQVIFISNNLLPFIRGFTGPGIRIGSYEFQHTHNSIREASEACSIDPNNGKYIVIDDLTYGYFRKSHGPVSFTYNRVGITKTPLQDLFRTVESDGMILDCNNMPEKFRKNSIRSNNICCLSKGDIKRLFIDASNSELN